MDTLASPGLSSKWGELTSPNVNLANREVDIGCIGSGAAVFIRALVLLALSEEQPSVRRQLSERRLSGGG
jgi:hypothetical protein